MRRCFLLWSLWLSLGWAQAAAAADAQPSPCRQALAALEAAQQQALAARQPTGEVTPAAKARVQLLQRVAARTCLGGQGDAPPPTASARPPVAVPPAPAPSAVPVPGAPRVEPPPPLPPPQPPVTVGACDANGCWSSDGRYLPRVAPGVLGSPAHCTVQGGVLLCP